MKVNQPSGEELNNNKSLASEMPTPLGSIVYTGLNKMGLNQASNFTELDENSGDNNKKIISKRLVSKDRIKLGAQINISSKESIF